MAENFKIERYFRNKGCEISFFFFADMDVYLSSVGNLHRWEAPQSIPLQSLFCQDNEGIF